LPHVIDPDAGLSLALAHFPRAARLDEETGAREYVVRGLPLLIIYVAADDWVEIIGIFHTARDPEGKPRP